MAFWAENYAFIKDVYDSRAEKMVDVMNKTELAIAAVNADKVYTSSEFKKVKEGFMTLSKSLEDAETIKWLTATKDTLMSDKSGRDQDEEEKRLSAILNRYDELLPKIAETKRVVDILWRSYQFSDELAPLMEWMEEMIVKSTREINSNSASQTEDLIEKQEKTIDTLDKKRKMVMDFQSRGDKLLGDPNAPKFLEGHMNKMKELWKQANQEAENRLAALKDNLSAWERYEMQRDALADKLNDADTEYMDTKKIFDMEVGPVDHATRVKTAAVMRKDIEDTYKSMSEANDILQKLLGDDKKAELTEEVEGLKERLTILERMDEKLKALDEFNKNLKVFDENLKELEVWLSEGRKRMDELVKPTTPIDPQDRVMATMELQSDVTLQIENAQKLAEEWEHLGPTEPGENTPEAQAFVARQEALRATQSQLDKEVRAEGEKFGEDLKHLADFTAGAKRFEPWIQKAEAKKAVGMSRPKNLEEALDTLDDAKKWKLDCEEMRKILEDANTAAQKMTLHDDADAKYVAFKKRWEAVYATAKDWIGKLEKMVEVWKRQAETAAKVSAAISAKPGEATQEMKLEDLEKHLDALKQMFIEKQKLMENLDKPPVEEAPAPAPAPTAPAPPPAPAPAAVST